MDIKDWLGADNQLGIDIWTKKYCYNNETFDQWLDRVSGGNKEIRNMIEEKKFLFGGRILANRGLEKTGRKIRSEIAALGSRPQPSGKQPSKAGLTQRFQSRNASKPHG